MALSSHGPLTAPWISHLPSAGEKLTSTESSPTYHILQCLISVRVCLKTGIEHTRTFTPPNSASEHGAPKPTTTSSLMSHDPEIPIASGLLDLLSSHDQPSKWIYSSVVQHYKSSLHDRSSPTPSRLLRGWLHSWRAVLEAIRRHLSRWYGGHRRDQSCYPLWASLPSRREPPRFRCRSAWTQRKNGTRHPQAYPRPGCSRCRRCFGARRCWRLAAENSHCPLFPPRRSLQ